MSACIFKNHQIIEEFNKKEGLKAPEVILIGERHRHDYNPANDRRLNNLVVEAFDKNSLFLVEYPSDQAIIQNEHPQTKNWLPGKRVLGCLSPEGFKKVCEIHDFSIKILNLLNTFKSVSLSYPELESLLKNDWKEEWEREEVLFPSQSMNENEYKKTLSTLAEQVMDLKNEIINSSHYIHATSLVTILKKYGSVHRIIVLLGKNHLYISKKLEKILSEQNDPSDEFQNGIKHLHGYLKESGKWCVIIKPNRHLKMTRPMSFKMELNICMGI